MTDTKRQRSKPIKPVAQLPDNQLRPAIDEIEGSDAQLPDSQRKSFEYLQRRADYVDSVLMEKGDPELDYSSG